MNDILTELENILEQFPEDMVKTAEEIRNLIEALADENRSLVEEITILEYRLNSEGLD